MMHKVKPTSKSGGISVAMMLIAFSLITVVGTYVIYSTHSARLAFRSVDHGQARIFARNHLGLVRYQLSSRSVKLAFDDISTLRSTISSVLQRPPTIEGYSTPIYTVVVETNVPFGLVNLAGVDTNGFTFVQNNVVDSDGIFNTGPEGRLRESRFLTAYVGVSNEMTGASAAVKQRIRIDKEPLTNYAIFSHYQLDFEPAERMVVGGDVRCNEDIFLLSPNDVLLFDGTIQAAGIIKIDNPKKNAGAARTLADAANIKVLKNEATVHYEDFVYQGKVLDNANGLWRSMTYQLFNGGVRDEEHRTPKLWIPMHDQQDLVDALDGGESQDLLDRKFAYIAQNSSAYKGLTITVDFVAGTSTVSLLSSVRSYPFATVAGGFGGNYIVNAPVGVSTNYYDFREMDPINTNNVPPRVITVDIYLEELLAEHPQSEIVFVDVPKFTNAFSGSNERVFVRLRNGSDLSQCGDAGLTIATPRSVLVEGDYNTVGTLEQVTRPDGSIIDLCVDPIAAIAADNITQLSTAWTDANALDPLPEAADTVLNASYISTGGYKNDKRNTGGVRNLIRFREHWGEDSSRGWVQKNYRTVGSIMKLWICNGNNYDNWCRRTLNMSYVPPRREFYYNENLLGKRIPGLADAVSDPLFIGFDGYVSYKRVP